MAGRAIVDTAFLVALLNADDDHHAWATGLVARLRGPWITAEACISEAVFLLEQSDRPPVARLLEWIEKGVLLCRHFLPEELEGVRDEMFRYKGRSVGEFSGVLSATGSNGFSRRRPCARRAPRQRGSPLARAAERAHPPSPPRYLFAFPRPRLRGLPSRTSREGP